MKELLSPGYGGAEKRPEVVEITDEPEGAGIPDAAGEGAVRDDPRVRRPYTEREMMDMQTMRSPRYPGDDPEYHHGVRGGLWERIGRLGSIAPVMGNPSLDPAAGDMIAVSYMAGYGSDAEIGHDSIGGIDDMVLGNVDATRELDAPSATEGSPLQIAPHESVYSDEHGLGTHNLRIGPAESGEAMSWTSEFKLYEHEPESNGRRGDDFDYTDEL